MAGSVSGQGEPNPAMWLAIRAGEMALACPLGITRCVPKPYNKSVIDQYLLGKDGWILASFLFCVFMDLDSSSVHKHAKKELNQYLTNSQLIVTLGQ